MTSTDRRTTADFPTWTYDPAADREMKLAEQFKGFPREPHLWVYALRTAVALAIRLWLKVYHRFRIEGIEHLPIGRAFILVANHQSHLDALMLTASVPLRFLHRAFPAAAADYFFRSVPRSAFASVIINGLPFARGGASSLKVCRELLKTPGNILILFPEGTRTTTGQPAPFRAGIGHLTAGTDIRVVPCYLDGVFRAFPKGALFPRPYRVTLRIGEARSYPKLERGKQAAELIAKDLEEAVLGLRVPDHEQHRSQTGTQTALPDHASK